MKTRKIEGFVLDDELRKGVDALVLSMKTTKSEIYRDAIREYLIAYSSMVKAGKEMMAIRDKVSDTA